LQDLILKFHREYGFTMIVVTHDLGEIFRLANLVAVIENGRVTKSGSPSEIYLPDENVNENLVLYGEVLTCLVHPDHLIVRALVQQNIRELKLPLHLASAIKTGSSFALKYELDNAEIKIIGL